MQQKISSCIVTAKTLNLHWAWSSVIKISYKLSSLLVLCRFSSNVSILLLTLKTNAEKLSSNSRDRWRCVAALNVGQNTPNTLRVTSQSDLRFDQHINNKRFKSSKLLGRIKHLLLYNAQKEPDPYSIMQMWCETHWPEIKFIA